MKTNNSIDITTQCAENAKKSQKQAKKRAVKRATIALMAAIAGASCHDANNAMKAAMDDMAKDPHVHEVYSASYAVGNPFLKLFI